jgi:hypothetical protein
MLYADGMPLTSLGMRRLYELDGRKSSAIDHGLTSPGTFLQVRPSCACACSIA